MSRAGSREDRLAASPGLAEQRYRTLERTRQPYLDEGRRCAALTIPDVCPPARYRNTFVALPKPNQGLGARGVDNLVGKFLRVLMPPGMPFHKLGLQPHVEDDLASKEEALGQVLGALSKQEMAFVEAVAQDGDRAGITQGFLHLPITGNVAIHLLPKGGVRFFGLDQYVVRRGPTGKVLELIICEAMPFGSLDKAHQQQLGLVDVEQSLSDTDTVEVFTRIHWDDDDGRYHECQEAKGIELEDTDGEYPEDALPWIVLRWRYVAGEHYARGLIELHYKDLLRFDHLSKAIGEAAKNAAKLLWLVQGGGGKSLAAALAKAESGDFVVGDRNAVQALQQEKAADLQVALKEQEQLRQELGQVFLLGSTIQRSGDRVTKFEVEYLARELESAYSNTYTILGREFQWPYYKAKTAQLTKRGVLSRLPKDALKVSITTGIDALGRGSDQQSLESFIAVAKEVAPMGEDLLNKREVMRRSAANLGIKPEGLIPTDEDVAAQQQQQHAQAITQQVAPEVAKGIAAGALQRQGAALQQQQQGGEPSPTTEGPPSPT